MTTSDVESFIRRNAAMWDDPDTRDAFADRLALYCEARRPSSPEEFDEILTSATLAMRGHQ